MSAYKKLSGNDVTVTPFTVNKSFSYADHSSDIDFINLRNQDYPTDGSGAEGVDAGQLVYRSVKHLYFTNFISGSDGLMSSASVVERNPDGTISGEFYQTNYENFLPSPHNTLRYMPPADRQMFAVSIPSKLYGNYLVPGSISGSYTNNSNTVTFTDDANGNLYSGSVHLGSVIYHHGMIVFTNEDGSGYLSPDTISSLDALTFSSSIDIMETQYACTIKSSEFNFSTNPTLLRDGQRGQNGILEAGYADYVEFATGSDFSPYITTVGLYNANNDLLAVAKLAQPLPTSPTTDTTIIISLDK